MSVRSQNSSILSLQPSRRSERSGTQEFSLSVLFGDGCMVTEMDQVGVILVVGC